MKLQNWAEFKFRLNNYSALTPQRRRQLIFRGHASADWMLNTTLDRVRSFATDQERNSLLQQLLREFRREAVGLTRQRHHPLAELHWEYLARHHGLPTRIMDWTESPYVAAYFAFETKCSDCDHVTVWVLDRGAFQQSDLDKIGVVETEELQPYNKRAYEQRSIMLRVDTIETNIEDMLGAALARFDIPNTERTKALADLDEMKMNARSLFRSLEGAARTAERRVIL